MSATKPVVNIVLLLLVLACAINQTMCVHYDDPTDFARAAKCPHPFLATAADLPIDSFHQRLYAFLAALGWVVKECLGSMLLIFKYFAFLVCVSAFGCLFIVTLDGLWRWCRSAAKNNVPFFIPPTTTTTTSTADSAPVFMPLPATTRPATQPTFVGQIPIHARICLVLASPLLFLLSLLTVLLTVGLVCVTAFLGAIQHGYVLLRESLGALKAKIGAKVRRSFTSVTFLCAITVAMVFGSYSSITVTSTKRRLTLKITKTKKGQRAAKNTRMHRRIRQRCPSLTLSSSTTGATLRTNVKEILRPALTTTTATLGSSSSRSSIVPTTTVEAERLRSETTTRAARGSFTNRVDIQEEEESKLDDYISTSVLVRHLLVDPAVAPQRKVNKLQKLGNYIQKAFKGKPKPQVSMSMCVNGISDFEVPAYEGASRKGSFFKKVFERKLSLSSSTSSASSSSSSPSKQHCSPSKSSFSMGDSIVQLEGTAY